MRLTCSKSSCKIFFIIHLIYAFCQAATAAYPPWRLTANNVTVESFSLTWESFDETIRQFVATISPLDGSETSDAVQHVTETRAVWNGLVSGKTYSVKVISEDNDGSVSQPTTINVTTVPLAPSNVRVSKFVNPILNQYQMDANRTMMYAVYGAVVMWEGPDVGHYDGFKVTVSPPDGMVRLPIELSEGEPVSQVKKKRRIIWDLVPGVYYEFFVRTTSGNRESEAAVSGERMPPEIPCPIRVDAIFPTSVTLSWNHRPHRGVIDRFIVEIDPQEGTEIEPENPEAKGRLIINLTPGTIYKIDVYSSSSGILSFQPRSIEIKTPPYPPVGPVYASNVSLTSVTIEWQWPVGNVDYYEVVYFPSHRDFGRLRHRTFIPSVELTSLDPDTEYSLILYSISNGVYSKPLQAVVWTKSLNSTTTSIRPKTSRTIAVTFRSEEREKPSQNQSSVWEKIHTTKPAEVTETTEIDSKNVDSTVYPESTDETAIETTSAAQTTPSQNLHLSPSSVKITTTQLSQVATTIDEFDIANSEIPFATGLPNVEIEIETIVPTTTAAAQLLQQKQTTDDSENISSTTIATYISQTPNIDVTPSTLSSTETTIENSKTSSVAPSEIAISITEKTTDRSLFKPASTPEVILPLQNNTEEKSITPELGTTAINDIESSTLLSSIKNVSKMATVATDIGPSTSTQTGTTAPSYSASSTNATRYSTSLSPTHQENSYSATSDSSPVKTILATTTSNYEDKYTKVTDTIEPTTIFPSYEQEETSITSTPYFANVTATTMATDHLATHTTTTDVNIFDQGTPTSGTILTSFQQMTDDGKTSQTSPKDSVVTTNSYFSTKPSTQQASSTENVLTSVKVVATLPPSGLSNKTIALEINSTLSQEITETHSSTMPHNWNGMKNMTSSPSYVNQLQTTLNPNSKNVTDTDEFELTTNKPSSATASSATDTESANQTASSSTESLPTKTTLTTSPNVLVATEMVDHTSNPTPTLLTFARTIRDETNSTSTTATVLKQLTTPGSTVINKEQIFVGTVSDTTTNFSQSSQTSSVFMPTTQSSGFEELPTIDIVYSIDPTEVPLVTDGTEKTTSQTESSAVVQSSTVSKSNEGTTSTNENVTKPPPERPMHIKDGFSTICKPNNITILVDKELIGKYEEMYGPLHLNDKTDKNCRGIEHPTYYRYTIAPNILDCGTRMELNETHVNFTNTVSNSFNETQLLRAVANIKGGIIVGGQPINLLTQFLHVRIWCTFPLDVNVSTLFPFLPQITLQFLTFNVSGYGEFSAVMQLYKTGAYKEAYPSPPRLNITDVLYVGINLLEIENNSTFVIVERCWGTPVRSPNHPGRYPIIDGGCPIKESLDGSVRILDNGNGTRVRWEGSVFKFLDYDEVWLHCEIRVCFGEDCKQSCNESRKRRSAEYGANLHIISTGPIERANKKSSLLDQSVLSTQTTNKMKPTSLLLEHTSLLVIATALSLIVIISCIVISCVVIYFRRHQPPQKYPLTTSSPANLSTSGSFVNEGFKTDQDFLLGSSAWNIQPSVWTVTRNRPHGFDGNGTSLFDNKNESNFWQDSRGISLKPNRHGPTMTSFKMQRSPSVSANAKCSTSLYTEKNPSSVLANDGNIGQFTQVV